jgi:hypothetical protein
MAIFLSNVSIVPQQRTDEDMAREMQHQKALEDIFSAKCYVETINPNYGSDTNMCGGGGGGASPVSTSSSNIGNSMCVGASPDLGNCITSNPILWPIHAATPDISNHAVPVPWYAPAGGGIYAEEDKEIIIYNEEQLQRMKNNIFQAAIAEVSAFESECVDEMYQANIFDGLRAERSAVVKAVRRLKASLKDKAEKICKT